MNKFRHNGRLVYRPTMGEHLLIALHTQGDAQPLHALTPTGAALWEAMDDWTTGDALTAALTERYEIDADQARRDVDAFIAQLRTLGAIEEQAS